MSTTYTIPEPWLSTTCETPDLFLYEGEKWGGLKAIRVVAREPIEQISFIFDVDYTKRLIERERIREINEEILRKNRLL